MTDAQRKALAALYMLTIEPPPDGNEYYTPVPERLFFKRWELGQKSKSDCSSYPVATMSALEVDGYVEPESWDCVSAVKSGLCRCGCDRWAITDKGRQFCKSLNIVKPKGKGP